VRRAAILGVAAAVAAALAAGPASALASDQVRVEPEGSPGRTVSLSGLGEPDVRGREYTVPADGGEQRVAITGWSLDRVIRAARVPPEYSFSDVEVEAGGISVTLERDRVTDPDAFPDGPPVLWVEEGAARFLLPASGSGGPVLLGREGQIAIRLTRPSRLRVTATASARRVRRGRPVTFTASVSGASAGEAVDLSWYFDDGSSGSGRRVTHRFRKPGTYHVVVGATTSRDEAGADDTVSVVVGKPPDGPDREGGGRNPDANAPDSGVGTGPSGPGDSTGGSGSGDSGGGSGENGSGDSGGEGAAADRDADRSAEERAAARRRAAEERAAARERAARRRAQRRRSARRDDSAERRSGPAARQVRGIELADLSALSGPAGRDALVAARRGRPRDDEDPGPGIPPAVWWALGTAGLLGLGGWREARSGPAGRTA
jgi:PKD domain